MLRRKPGLRVGSVSAVIVVLVARASSVLAQGAAAPASLQAPPMVLTTTAWADGGQIPVRYTQAGDQLSPELRWTNVPVGTRSFVFNMLDPDVALQHGTEAQPHGSSGIFRLRPPGCPRA